jgi:uncharacterized protein (TIGR00369 family)
MNLSAIWTIDVTPELFNKRNADTLSPLLGIVFTEVGEDYLVARMPVTSHHLQPQGIMHGGASCVLAETVGSVGANYCIDVEKQYCVGLDINTNHIRAVRSGDLFATGKPYHLGRTTQVWSIEICDAAKKLVSVTRLTLLVLEKNIF